MTLPFVSVSRANKTSALMWGERESERKRYWNQTEQDIGALWSGGKVRLRQNKLFRDCFLVVFHEQEGIERQNGSGGLSAELQGHFSSPFPSFITICSYRINNFITNSICIGFLKWKKSTGVRCGNTVDTFCFFSLLQWLHIVNIGTHSSDIVMQCCLLVFVYLKDHTFLLYYLDRTQIPPIM